MDVKSSSCKRSRNSHVPRMRIVDLPLMILIDILSRLSIKSIFQCKTVCKLWYNVLSYDPLFVKMYQTRSQIFPCIYLIDGVGNPSFLEIKPEYSSYAHHCNRPIQLTPKFHYPPGSVFLVGLCNGFTCFVNDSTNIDQKHSLYIGNPLLGEYFEVKLPKWEITDCGVTYGFCFSKASGKYKVLRLVVGKLTKVSGLEVYTLGVGEKWRNVGKIPCPACYKFGKANINGALHWMDSEKIDIIYSFDIETEKVKSLPAPPGLVNPPWNLKLVELGNYLCLTDYYNTNIDIWRMKEYGVSESWTKDIILVDSIQRGLVHFNFEPILMWKDGEILIQSGTRLALYDPKMKSFRLVYFYSEVITAITYIPSFYSLKLSWGTNFKFQMFIQRLE